MIEFALVVANKAHAAARSRVLLNNDMMRRSVEITGSKLGLARKQCRLASL